MVQEPRYCASSLADLLIFNPRIAKKTKLIGPHDRLNREKHSHGDAFVISKLSYNDAVRRVVKKSTFNGTRRALLRFEFSRLANLHAFGPASRTACEHLSSNSLKFF